VAPRTVTECGRDGNERGRFVFLLMRGSFIQELFHDERPNYSRGGCRDLIAGIFSTCNSTNAPRAGLPQRFRHDACACRCAGGRARRACRRAIVPVIATAAPAPVAAAPAGPANPATIPQAQRVKLWARRRDCRGGGDRCESDRADDGYLSAAGGPGQRSAVMVLPGGGYTNLSMANEGSSIAKCC